MPNSLFFGCDLPSFVRIFENIALILTALCSACVFSNVLVQHLSSCELSVSQHLLTQRRILQWLINIKLVWMPVSNVQKSVSLAVINVSAKWRNAHASASIAQTSAGPARHSLAGIPDSSQSSAVSAPRFATRVPQNAPSTITNIADAVLRPADAVRKNAGKWPRALGHGNSRPQLDDKVRRTSSGRGSSSLALARGES